MKRGKNFPLFLLHRQKSTAKVFTFTAPFFGFFKNLYLDSVNFITLIGQFFHPTDSIHLYFVILHDTVPDLRV